MTIDLHYKCGIVLFLSSVAGCLLAFQRRFDVTPVRPFSTGIIFGVALCHLLPDSSQVLDTQHVTEWFMSVTRLEGSVGDDGLYETLPVAETLMCLGIFIMLVIDQCIPCPHHHVQSYSANNSPVNEKARLLPSITVANGTAIANGTSNGTSNSTAHETANSSTKCCSDHGAIPLTPMNTSTSDNTNGIFSIPKIPNAKVYATEIAIAIHSIIIGFSMGVNPNTDALVGFTIAMVFHQMFEGVALAMIARQGNLGFHALAFMVLMFASSLPVGIAIGLAMYRIVIGQEDDDINDVAVTALDLSTILFQGVPNAISAGMLLHIGFELMMEDFNHHSTEFPTKKLVLAFLGGAMFCFIAIWA